jgi:glycosyltransferase involved in cell wall biosynthesis
MSLKVLFFISEDWFFCSHFIERAVAARAAGYEVVVVTRERLHGHVIRDAGLRLIPIEFDRRSTHPWRELVKLRKLLAIYVQERPDIVHHIAAKPIFYGSVLCRLLGIRAVVNAPVGMGYVFSSSDIKARLLRPFIRLAYLLFLNPPGSRVIFENGQDLDSFVKFGAAKAESAVLIRGAGINLSTFSPRKPPADPPVVMLIARMLRDKGVVEFVSAARMLHSNGVSARFVLVGDSDPGNPASISAETLASWHGRDGVECWGWRNDVEAVLRQAHIVCLPSYREGLPKSLLEAAACGLPIVTTDTVGCRDVVNHEINGLLVPVKSIDALAGALLRLIRDPDLRQSMGIQGRQLAEREFSSERIIAETLAVYERVTGHRPLACNKYSVEAD